MYTALSRTILNAVYLVPLRVKRLLNREPGTQVLAAGATKAQRTEREQEVRREFGWVTSRRGVLILTAEKLICGSWVIPLSTITDATLLQVRTFAGLGFTKGLILKISTDRGYHYQFGFTYDPAWEEQTALKLSVEDGKVKYSAYSIIVRIVICVLVIWYLLSPRFSYEPLPVRIVFGIWAVWFIISWLVDLLR